MSSPRLRNALSTSNLLPECPVQAQPQPQFAHFLVTRNSLSTQKAALKKVSRKLRPLGS